MAETQRSSTPRTAGAALVVLAAIAVPSPGGSQEQRLSETGVLMLEESQSHLISRPNLSPDPLGGWLYWDSEAGEVQLFDSRGRLQRALGREGDGPGEFRGLLGVVRVADGRLVTLDRRGRVGIWSERGDSLVRGFDSGIRGARSFVAAGQNRIAVSSVDFREDGRIEPVLTTLQVDTQDTTTYRYFPVMAPEWDPVLAAVSAPRPVWHSGRLHVAAPPADSLWAISIDRAAPVSRTAISSDWLSITAPPREAARGRTEWFRWLESAAFVGNFFPVRGGDWIMQGWGPRSGRWDRRIFRFDDEGTVLWEINDSRNLLSVDFETGRMYLWDPQQLDPGAISIAVAR